MLSWRRLILIVSLIVVIGLEASPVFVESSGQSTTSSATINNNCTASNTFTWIDSPTPNSLLDVAAAGPAPLDIATLEYGSGLLGPNPTGGFQTQTAITNWISHNANYSQWTFNIKPGLKWSDGTPVTSQDILATYSSNFMFNASYDFTGVHTEVTSETALNSSAVQFNLNVSDAHLPETLSLMILTSVYPAKLIQKYGLNYNWFNATEVLGPFYLSNYTGGSEATLLRNPYFYTTGLPEPKICQINMVFVESGALAVPYFASGQADLSEVDAGLVSSILKNSNNHILDEPATNINDLGYNVTVYPYNMTAFRQALAFGINQTQINQQAFFNYSLTAYSSEGGVPTAISSLYNPNQMNYSFNPQKSLSLLQSIGFTGGNGSPLKYPNGTDVTLSLWTDTTRPYDVVAAGIVRTDLQNLGMTINLNTVSEPTLYSDTLGLLDGTDAAMILTSSGGPVFPVPFVDASPAPQIYQAWSPWLPGDYWDYPPSVNAEYMSNYTAIQGSAEVSQETHYLDNIQSLQAQYLPEVVLSYPGDLWAYSTQRWTNWTAYPKGYTEIAGSVDWAQFAYLTPVSSSTTGTGGSGSLPIVYIASGIIIVVAIAAGTTFIVRRRRSSQPPPTSS